MVEESVQKYWTLTQKELAVRVEEWEQINERLLLAVNSSDMAVELKYDSNGESRDQIRHLAESENRCCGAAGVEFAFRDNQTDIRVTIKNVKDGLPARTVLAAFANFEVHNDQDWWKGWRATR